MNQKTFMLPGWLQAERSLMTYLACPHPGHTYAEDLIDAVALMAAWLMAGTAAVLVVAVLVEGWLQ